MGNQHDLWPTDLNINRDLPSLKLEGQSIVEVSVAQGIGDQHDLDIWPIDLNINRYLLIKEYLPAKFEASLAKCSWVISYIRLRATNIPTAGWTCVTQHELWPTDLNINRDHLLILDYLTTKFEACRTKHCWVISCTRYRRSTWTLTSTFDILTWISIGITWTIFLPSLKLLGQSVLELSVAGRPTYQPTERGTYATQYALLLQRGA